MNFEQLKEKLEEIGIERIGHDDYDEEEIGIELEVMVDEGGYEGAGEHVEKVLKYVSEEEGDIFIRIQGYYSSYAGTTWEDSEFEQVFPKNVMVTQYLNDEELKRSSN